MKQSTLGIGLMSVGGAALLAGAIGAFIARAPAGAPRATPPVVAATEGRAALAPAAVHVGPIAGIGLIEPDAESIADGASIRGRFPPLIEVTAEADVANRRSCDRARRVAVLLDAPGTLELVLYALDAQGHRGAPAWRSAPATARSAGLQTIEVGADALPFAQFEFEVRLVASAAAVDVVSGRLLHAPRLRDTTPLAHSFVKSIDLFDAHLTVTAEDINLGGRGPSFLFSRAYSSMRAEAPGLLGRGWTAVIESRVVREPCGQILVIGANGDAQRFEPVGQPRDGAQAFRALYGYHGTLLRKGEGFEFYSKNGTLYRFAEIQSDGAHLSSLSDPNGNRIDYLYEERGGRRLVARMVDGAARSLEFEYTAATAQPLLRRLRGPLGAETTYEHDGAGRLIRVRSVDASGKGERVTEYDYRDYGDSAEPAPAGGTAQLRHLGARLVCVRDALDGTEQHVDYERVWLALPSAQGPSYAAELRVTALTEYDGGRFAFALAGVPGRDAMVTTVTTSRGHATVYRLNAYGAAESVTDPAGTHRTVWDAASLQPSEVTDATGLVTRYTYDPHGNKIAEEVRHPKGIKIARAWTYAAPTQFDPPYIKERIATATDGRGIVTRYEYDRRGNWILEARGGKLRRMAYDEHGDLVSSVQANRSTWRYEYDASGLLAAKVDPAGGVARLSHDALGRLVSKSDLAGDTIQFTYDARGRPLSRTPAKVDDDKAVAHEYNDRAGTHTAIDKAGKRTVYTYDSMGRLVKLLDPDGRIWSATFDTQGNKLRETDFARNITKYEYDAVDRLIKKTLSEDTTVEYEYDEVGHILSERTRSKDEGETIRVFGYEHPSYKATFIGVRDADGHTRSWKRSYDGNGNRIQETGPDGKLLRFQYDDQDRQTGKAETADT